MTFGPQLLEDLDGIGNTAFECADGITQEGAGIRISAAYARNASSSVPPNAIKAWIIL
jgi:hypothetical protein